MIYCLIPLLLAYIGHYYALRHDHKHLLAEYGKLIEMNKQAKMSENQEEKNEF